MRSETPSALLCSIAMTSHLHQFHHLHTTALATIENHIISLLPDSPQRCQPNF